MFLLYLLFFAHFFDSNKVVAQLNQSKFSVESNSDLHISDSKYSGLGTWFSGRKKVIKSKKPTTKRLVKRPKLGYLTLGVQVGFMDFPGRIIMAGIQIDHLWTINDVIDLGYFTGTNIGIDWWVDMFLTIRGGMIALFGKRFIRFETSLGVYSIVPKDNLYRGFVHYFHAGVGMRINPGNRIFNIRFGCSTTSWAYAGISFQLGTKKRE